MRVVVTGASGLVGTAVSAALRRRGDAAIAAVRHGAGPDEIAWDPAAARMAPASLAGVDAVVHLAGESIAAARWNDAVKRRIRESRVAGTDLVARTVARAAPRPATLVCASAVGFYGDRGDEVLDESAPRGAGFLADVCDAWERAADPARDAGVRVVHLRFGVVLDRDGGALPKILRPFRLGAGGTIGNGRQWMSWIALDDAAALVVRALDDAALAGPVNATSPQPVTNREFTKAVGRVLRRLTLFPLPAPVARVVLGEMADELLLASQRAVPRRAQERGFAFAHPEVEGALRSVLGR